MHLVGERYLWLVLLGELRTDSRDAHVVVNIKARIHKTDVRTDSELRGECAPILLCVESIQLRLIHHLRL